MTSPTTAVVIPSYRVSETIAEVVLSIPAWVDHIIVVDDHCPDSSGKAAERLGRANVTVLYHPENRGVGGAVITGYRKALELGCGVVVKMDGDGQMDPSYLEALIEPLTKDAADYSKGNRFRDFTKLRAMPGVRLFGNSALSFLVKAASGYWNIMDPTNGYTAIHERVLRQLSLEKIATRFFFESDMLIHLNILNAVVADVDIPARYGEETSTLNVKKILYQFPPKLMRGLVKRIFLKYFVYDFNMASVYLLLGLPMFTVSVLFGIREWADSIISGVPRTAGTIMLVALPIIVSFQMLLQAVSIDVSSVPRRCK